MTVRLVRAVPLEMINVESPFHAILDHSRDIWEIAIELEADSVITTEEANILHGYILGVLKAGKQRPFNLVKCEPKEN